MSKIVYEITCPTCESRFTVDDPELAGQIIACPSCGSMMMVSLPEVPADPKPADPNFHTDDLSVNDPRGNEFIANGQSSSPSADKFQEDDDLSASSIEIVSENTASFELPDCIKGGPLTAPPILADSNHPDHALLNAEFEKNFGLPSKNELREPPVLGKDYEELKPPVLDEEELSSSSIFAEVNDAPPKIISIEKENAVAAQTDPENRPQLFRPLFAVLSGLVVSLLIFIGFLLIRGGNPENAETAMVPPVSEAPKDQNPSTESSLPNVKTEPKTDPSPEKPASPEQKGLVSPTDPMQTESKTAPAEEEKGKPENPSVPKDPDDPSPSAPLATEKAPSPAPKTTEVKSEEKELAENEADEKKEFVETTLTTQTSIQKILPTLKKEIAPIDLEAGLKISIPKCDFAGNKLSDVFRVLSGLSGVPIGFDLSCFELIRGSAISTVDLHLGPAAVEEILAKIADLLHLEIRKDKSGILFTLPDAKKTVFEKKEYTIDGLLAEQTTGAIKVQHEDGILSSPLPANELSLALEELIDPPSWKKNGGKGKILIANKKMEIEQTALNHYRIELFLEHLRQFRAITGKSNLSKEERVPELFGWETLSAPISLNYLEPVPFLETILLLEQKKDLRVFIDYSALREEGIDLDTPVIVRINNGTIDQVLNALLTPLHLTYIILGKQTLLITSSEIANSYKTLELHLYRLPEEKKLEDTVLQNYIKRLQAENAPGSWLDRKKPDPEKASITADPESGFLLIRQSQPVQRMIRQWIERNPSDKISTEKTGTNSK
ncbi:MAG: hypothetical protein Q4G69_06415 [Planctomycetia bacterium]|nr:hypothetical protein [Planctomycetia bacterium]